MKKINSYIIEKLKINKDIKTEERFKSVLDKIINIGGLSQKQIGKEMCDYFTDEIKHNWIDKYNIKEVKCIITDDIKKANPEFFTDYKDYIEIDDYEYKYFNEKVKKIIADDQFELEVYVQDIVGYKEHALKIGSYNDDINFSIIFVEI